MRALTFFALLVFLPASTGATADSLFPVKEVKKTLRGSANTNLASLYADTHAKSVGDILTVVISETTTAKATAASKTSKDENVSGVTSTGLFNQLFRSLNMSAGSNRSANGTGETGRTGTITTTLSVQVKEILDNGVLKIEGSRLITINKETQRVTLTGLIRPEDITQDNSIASALIADAQVKYDGKGIVGDTQKMGLITRIFRSIF